MGAVVRWRRKEAAQNCTRYSEGKQKGGGLQERTVTPCQQKRHTFASRAQQERHADLEACLLYFLQPSRQGGKDEAANQATAANGEKDSNVEKKSARTGRACFPGIKGLCQHSSRATCGTLFDTTGTISV